MIDRGVFAPMSLTKRFLPLLVWACAIVPATSHALACREDGSNSTITTRRWHSRWRSPPMRLNGSIIWELGPRSTDVICKDDYKVGREQVYFYVNPGTSASARVFA